MYNRDLEQRYFVWLIDKIDDGEKAEQYKYLLHKLHEINYWSKLDVPLDSNRYDDGVNLRYLFAEERQIPQPVIASELDIRDCSMLEMLVALSIRIEESGMGIPYEGINPGRWFWMFVKNIGYFYSPFNDDMIYKKTDIFLNRKFNPDGSNGNLVVLNKPDVDLRIIDIWYQIQLYLANYND